MARGCDLRGWEEAVKVLKAERKPKEEGAPDPRFWARAHPHGNTTPNLRPQRPLFRSCLGWVWEVYVPSEEVVGALGMWNGL